MQLFLIATAIFSCLTLASTAFSKTSQLARQTILDLPLSLCALNLESTNDYIIDAVCAGPFEGAEIEIVNSKLSLDKCLTNSFGQLKVNILPSANNKTNYLQFALFGGFSSTCNECKLDSSILDFSCTCDNEAGDSSGVISDINLVLATPDGASIFLKDDGNIACQASNV